MALKSAVNKQYFFGYKLHVVATMGGEVHSMALNQASVHDLRYLDDVKHSWLNNCVLLGDKGYLSSECSMDLLTTRHIRLNTQMRTNQEDFRSYSAAFGRSRNQIKTLFPQLCEHLMMRRNYAKSLNGSSGRLIYKLTAVSCLQRLNEINGRPINQIQHALEA